MNAADTMEKSRLPLFGRTSSSSKKKKQQQTSGCPMNPVAAAFTNATAMGMADVSTNHNSRRYHRDNSLVSTFVSNNRAQTQLSDNKSLMPMSSVSCFGGTSNPTPYGVGRGTTHVIISSDRRCYPVSAACNEKVKPGTVGKLHNDDRDSNSVSSMSGVVCSTEQSHRQQPNRGHRSLPDKKLRSPPSLRSSVSDAKIGVGNVSIPIMCRGSPLPLRRQEGTGGSDRRTTACLVKPHRSYSNPEERHLPTSTPTPNTEHTQHQSLLAMQGCAKENPSPVSDTCKGTTDESAVAVRHARLYSYPEDTECDEPLINGDQYKDSQPQQALCSHSAPETNRTSKDKRWANHVAVTKHPQQIGTVEKQGLSLAGLPPNCECRTNIYESLPPSPIYETIDQVYVRAFPKTVSGAFVSPCCGVRMAELRATKRVSYTRSHSASPEPHSLTSPPPLPPRNPGTKISGGGEHEDCSDSLRPSTRATTMQYVGEVPETVWHQGSSSRPSPVGTLLVDQCYTNTQTCLTSELSEQTIWNCKGTNENDFSQQSAPGWGEDNSHTGDMSPVYSNSSRRNSGKDTRVGALQQNLPDLVNVIEIAAHKKESGMPQYRNVPKKQLPQRASEAQTNSKNLSNDIDQALRPRAPHLGSSDRKPITIIRDTTIHEGPHLRKTVKVMAAERCDVESKIKRFEGGDSAGVPHRDRSNSGSRGKYDQQQPSTSNICNKWRAATKLKSVGVRQKTIAANTATTDCQKSPPETSAASQVDTGIHRSNKPQGLARVPSKSKLQYSEQQNKLSRSRQSIAKARSRTTPVESEMVKKQSSCLPAGPRANERLGSTRQLVKKKQSCQPRAGRDDLLQSTSSNEPCSSVTSSCTSLASVFSECNSVSAQHDPRRQHVLKGRNNHPAPTKGYSEMSMENDSGTAEKVMHDAQKPSKPVHVKQSKQHKICKLPLNRSGSFSDVQSCNSNASSKSRSTKSKQVRPIAASKVGVRAGGGGDDGLGIDPVLDRCAYSEEKVKNWSCVPDGQQQLLPDPTNKLKGKNIQRRQISSRTSQQSKLPPRPVRAECTSPPASVTSVGSQAASNNPSKKTTPVKASPSNSTHTADSEQGSVNGTVATAKKQVSYSTKLAKVSRLKPPGATKKSADNVTAENKPSVKPDGGCDTSVGGGGGLKLPASPKTCSSTGDVQRQPSVKHRRKPTQPESAVTHRDSHGDDDTEICSSLGSAQPDLTKHAPESGLMLVKPYSVKKRGQQFSCGIFTKTSFENDADATTIQATGRGSQCRQEPSSSTGGDNDSSCDQSVKVESKYNICTGSTTMLTLEKQSQLPQKTNKVGDQDEHASHLIGNQLDCQANSPENAASAAVVLMDPSPETIQQCDGHSRTNCTQSVSAHAQEGHKTRKDKPAEQRCVSASETNTKTSAINKADVYYQLSDPMSTQLTEASSVDRAISDVTTKAAAMTPIVSSKTKADCSDNFTNRSSDAVGSRRLDRKDNVDCSYQDNRKMLEVGHLPALMAVQPGKTGTIKVASPEQCTDYRSEMPTCKDKGCVYDVTSVAKPSAEDFTYLESSLASECNKTQGSTESLACHHADAEDAAVKVKDAGQASSDLLGNIRLSESGYDSWKSQGSNSTTCGRDELIEIDVASWGIFDDKGETFIPIDGVKKTAVILEELPFATRRVRGRVCSDACPSASLSGSEDTLTPERIIDGNDFGSEIGSSISAFGDNVTADWIGPNDQSTVKTTKKTEPVRPAVCSSSVEKSAVPLPTNSVATEMAPGGGLVALHPSLQTVEPTAVDMLFSNMYSHNDNNNRTETDKPHNAVLPVNSMSAAGGTEQDTKDDTTPVVKLRRPKPKQSRLAQRPDTLFPSTPSHSRINENTELQASCDIGRSENPWPSAPSPLWKNKRHSAILSPGRDSRPVSLSSSSPSLDTLEQEGEQQGLLAYISTSYLLDEGTLRRSTATSTLNMQRKQEAEEAIVETAVSETSLHVQPSDKDSCVKVIDFEIAAEKSVIAITKTETVSTTPKLFTDKPSYRARGVSVSDKKRVTCDVTKADDLVSQGSVDRKENRSGSVLQPAVSISNSASTETSPQPFSGHGACVSTSTQQDSVSASMSLHTNSVSKSKLQAPASHQRVSKLRPVTSVKSNITVKPANTASKDSVKDKGTASPGLNFQSMMGSLRQATVTLYRKTSSRTSSPGGSTTQACENPSVTLTGKADMRPKLATGIATKSPGSSGIPSAGKNTTKPSKLASSFSPKLQAKSGIPGKPKKKSSSTSDSPECEKPMLKCALSDPPGKHMTGKNGDNVLGHESQIPPKSPTKTTQDSRIPPASGVGTKTGLSRISRPVHPRLGAGKSMVKLPRSTSDDSRR
ncbi:hypothetical protein LSAT2_025576 [Lamellibrachia satsuma]|nr:hypothetical protein LSAT2_025576 [Lamellibrachia satsuma]